MRIKLIGIALVLLVTIATGFYGWWTFRANYPPEPAFTSNQRVIISSGFYRGQIGELVGYVYDSPVTGYVYYVKVMSNGELILMPETDLKPNR